MEVSARMPGERRFSQSVRRPFPIDREGIDRE
jgi:hypothetical protein